MPATASGALLAQSGDVPAAIERFRAALQVKPDFPDALNNLGFALFQTGQADQAYDLYQKALKLQPDFPEALNNLGIFFGRQGDLDRALGYFREAVEQAQGLRRGRQQPCPGARGPRGHGGGDRRASRLLQENPGFEMAYVTLSKIYLKAGRRAEGVQVLERLLQRNPTHPLGLQILRQLQVGG